MNQSELILLYMLSLFVGKTIIIKHLDMRFDGGPEIWEISVFHSEFFTGLPHDRLDLSQSGVDEPWEQVMLNLIIETSG